MLAALVLGLAVPLAFSGAPAQALVKPPVIDGERLLGGVVKTGKGVSRFGKLVPGPVGAILTAGSLAWWAYSEYDQKVNAPQPGGTINDWLTEEFAAYPSTMNDGMITATVTSVSGRVISLDINCAAWVPKFESPPGHWYYGCGAASNGEQVGIATTNTTVADVDCRNTSTGVHTIRALSATWGRGAWTDNTATINVASAAQCATGEVIDGFRLGASDPRHSSAWWRQAQPIGWGTMAGATVPDGDLTFQTAVVDVTCRNAATDAVQHIYATSNWGEAGTIDLPSCKQRLGEDWYGTGVKVIPMDPEIDDIPVDPEIWPDWDVPDFVPEEWTEEEATPEEEADPCFGTKRGCGLTVEIDGEPVFPGTTTRTKIDTLIGTEPERVTCKWGTREVEWKYCVPILGTFDSPTGTTNIDPTKPDTGTDTTVPGTGTINSPVPTDAKGCMAEAVSWNPVDWVYVPVKCALKWAFVPNPASWGWPAFVDQVMARPPTSIAVALVTQMQAVATGFGSGSCGVLADFGDGMAITCPAIQAIPGYGALYALVQVALVGLTGFTVFHMFRSVLGSEGNG